MDLDFCGAVDSFFHVKMYLTDTFATFQLVHYFSILFYTAVLSWFSFLLMTGVK